MQRGLVFFNYLWNLGDHAPANHRLYILDGVQASCGHDAACMYGSALGQQVLLGQTVSAAPFDPATTVIPDLDAACRVCP